MAVMSAKRKRNARAAQLDPETSPHSARSWIDGFLRSYSQLFFSRSRLTGLLLVAATAIDPRLFAYGALAVVISLILPRLLGLSPDVVKDGLYGYNALLVGLAGAAMLEPSWPAFGLTMFGVCGTVVATAAAQSVLGTVFGLPILTVPFLAVVYLLLSAAPYLEIAIASFPGNAPRTRQSRRKTRRNSDAVSYWKPGIPSNRWTTSGVDSVGVVPASMRTSAPR